MNGGSRGRKEDHLSHPSTLPHSLHLYTLRSTSCFCWDRGEGFCCGNLSVLPTTCGSRHRSLHRTDAAYTAAGAKHRSSKHSSKHSSKQQLSTVAAVEQSSSRLKSVEMVLKSKQAELDSRNGKAAYGFRGKSKTTSKASPHEAGAKQAQRSLVVDRSKKDTKNKRVQDLWGRVDGGEAREGGKIE